jgi:hypothetical protein
VPQLDAVNARLLEAIARAQAFYAALSNNPEALAALGVTAEQVQNIALKLDTAKLGTQQLGEFMGVSLGQFAQTATDSLVSVRPLGRVGGRGRNVFRSVLDAFLGFASEFLRQIVRMIQQQIIF